MTIPSKILLTAAVIGLAGGSMIDYHGVNANPSLAAVLPLGAIATGLFLIVFMMEKEMAGYDQEQTVKTQRLQSDTAAAASPQLKLKSISAKQSAAPALAEIERDDLDSSSNPAAPSLKLKDILVPVDFSDSSKKAVQYAVHFARQINARIILLHVLPPISSLEGEYEDESAHKLRAWADEFVPDEVPVLIQTRRGAEAIEIVNEAKNFETGLMIISTQGRTGRAHALAGSLAENLVQLAPCPVLVVREHEYDFIETTGNKNGNEPMPHFVAPII